MNKIIVTLLIVVSISFVSKAQTLKEATKALKQINNIVQIDVLKAQHPKWSIYIDKTMHSDSSQRAFITNNKIGDIVKKQFNPQAPTYIVKILKDQNEELCKLKYIFLNGNELSNTEIDSIRALIIEQYNKGEDFEKLVKTYTMDSNPTGELNWFYKGMMVEEFDNKVRNRKKGEIFTVDVKENNWFYVVLKTHDNKVEKARVSLMIEYTP